MIVAEGIPARLAGLSPVVLQWGRNMIVAEGRTGDGNARGRYLPSMGPQHDSCGRI